jgi:hypothetical protein
MLKDDRVMLARHLSTEMGDEIGHRQLYTALRDADSSLLFMIDSLWTKLEQSRQNFNVVVGENHKLKNMLTHLALTVAGPETSPRLDENCEHERDSHMLSTNKVLIPRRSSTGSRAYMGYRDYEPTPGSVSHASAPSTQYVHSRRESR